jgi:cyclophilin family peptidyl-prolyl cis-trans isomerase
VKIEVAPNGKSADDVPAAIPWNCSDSVGGDGEMQTIRLLAGTCLAVVMLLALVGCGNKSGGDDQASTASASDSGEGQPSGAAPADAKKSKTADRLHPAIAIETSLGKITVRLDAEHALLTVDNFLQYVDEGQYSGTIFHQVNKGYAVLGGAYDKDLGAKPGRVPIRNEAHNGLKNRRGTIAMARQPDAIDSATRQFFINLADNGDLDHKDSTPAGYGYCVFGEVIEGLDVLEKIGGVAVRDVPSPDGSPFQAGPVEPVVIQSIRRVER